MASQYRRRSLMLNTIAKVAQGNPTIITDSSSRRLQKLNIYGQSEQDSTTGAQLLSLDMLVSDLPYSINGVTFSDNGDGGIKVTGTVTGTATLFFNDMINNLEDGKTYSYNSDTELGRIQVNYNDGTPTDYIRTITVNKSKMISIKPYMQYANGSTVNKVLYPMLNIGNSVKPFEPYTGGKPSPSPDYPQEIISKEVSEIKVTNGADLSQTITLTEPIALRGLPVTLVDGNIVINAEQYISDCIKEKDGVIGIERNLNELLVSSLGVAGVSQGAHTNGQNYLSCNVGNAYRLTVPLSNRYRGTQFTMNDKCVYVPSAVGFVITDSRFADKETAISIITEEQTKVVYVMNEPTFEPLSEEIQSQYKALKSYYPNTVIQTGCWNEVTYSAKRGG